MKILHIPNFYPPSCGGIERTCKYIVDRLSEHENRVICFNNGDKTLNELIDGILVIRVGVFKKVASQALSFSFFRILHDCIKEYQPDLIHFHYPNPFSAAVLLCYIPRHCRLVVHWHSDIIEQKILYRLIKPIETYLLKRADSILITSPNYIHESMPLRSFKNKVDVLASAIEVKEYGLLSEEHLEVEKIKDLYERKKIIFFAGRHVKYKGLVYLLEAEKFIQNDCIILIAGSGPLTNEFKKKYTSTRIVWLGRVSDLDLKYYYYATDIFAFPSITKNEAFGLVLAEAMYCSCPTVTFTIPGSGVNWVSPDRETGIEVENGNSKQFASAIDELLVDDKRRLLYAYNARKRVLEYFSMDNIEVDLKRIYNKLLINNDSLSK